jgi:hypothetical protein
MSAHSASVGFLCLVLFVGGGGCGSVINEIARITPKWAASKT